MVKQIRPAHETWKYLSQENNFQQFMKEFLLYLQNNLQLIQVHGDKDSYEYYSCGQPHDPRNPKWKPFKHLEWYCERTRFDFLAVKEIIQDRIGRKLTCECQLLNPDEKERRRMTLQKVFGVDLGGRGKRENDIV